MTEKNHPVDDALRRLTSAPEPTDKDRRSAEARLHDAIRAETDTPASRQRREFTRWMLAAMVTALAVLLFVQVVRPSATMAAMEEIARATEAADPLNVSPQNYVYTRSEITALRVVPRERLGDTSYQRHWLVYLLPVHRESWIGADGAIQLRTTTGQPLFFRPEDEIAYAQTGLDEEDAVGESVTQTVQTEDPQPWPEDIEALDRAVRTAAAGRERGPTVEYIDVALDIIRETSASPQLRANTLRLIGRQPELELVEATSEGLRFAIGYTDNDVTHQFTFMITRQGHLIGEEATILDEEPNLGIPAGTRVFSANYTVPELVQNLDAPR